MDLNKYLAKAEPKKTIREHTDELLQNANILYQLNYISDQIYGLLRIACEYHDYGKVNPSFQKRIQHGSKFNAKNEIAHNVLSLFFIDKNLFEDEQDYYNVVYAVLNHHDYCNAMEVIDNDRQLIKDLLDGFKIYNLKKRNRNKIIKACDNKDAILIKGLLHKCDYSASAGIPIEFSNNFLIEGLQNLLLNWQQSYGDAEWNEMQKFCIKNREENIVVIAQTGLGKTEAGLHWIGNNKGFFVLPLKTAINAIYSRVKNDVLQNKDINKKLALLHSDALGYYFKDFNDDINILDYYYKSKQLSMPLSISTLDQMFNFVFKYPGYELYLATLSYSKVVIDEIQMYSSDLLAYLIYGLKQITSLGGKFAILTATLPPFILDLLEEKDIFFKQSTFITELRRHNIKVYDTEINSEIIIKLYEQNIANDKSNKILVICNTVKKAQELYKVLENKGIQNINILHSKFIKKHRAEKENMIKNYGETYKKNSDGTYILDKKGNKILNNDTCVWITTQIVEASLDIDFDYIFTELSDLNGLFQRLGRCNRKGEKSIDSPNCFVFTEINNMLLKNGDRGFIDKKVYEVSREAILGVDGIITEKEKIGLINNYLITDNLCDSDYIKDYISIYDYIERLYSNEYNKKETMKKFRNIISYNVIPKSVYDENKKIIDENIKFINETKWVNNNIEQIIKSKERVKDFTVPVGYYDIYFSNNVDAIKQRIKIKKEEILIVDCEYTDIGFVRQSVNKSNNNMMLEESFDNFI